MARRRPGQLRGASQRAKLRNVAERDGFRCWICGGDVDMTPDPTGSDDMRASIDHVLPLSEGGTNANTNLRLAHQRCNEQRDRLGRAA